MSNTLKKVLLFALIGVFVAGSLTLIMWQSLRSTGLSIRYEAVDDGLALAKYNGTSENTRLVVPDFAQAEDGSEQPVTALGEFSVANATYLEELYIGANVREIHPWALTNCEALRRIDVDPANTYFTSVDGVLYTHDMTKLLLFPNQNTDSFVIPESVTAIGENAFYKCKNLLEVTFPSGLRMLEDRAFFRCASLTELRLPAGLEIIGIDAFAFCDALEGEVVIPASCREIKAYAFSSKDSKIDKIVILADEDEITLAEDWLPMREKKANARVEYEFAGGAKSQ